LAVGMGAVWLYACFAPILLQFGMEKANH